MNRRFNNHNKRHQGKRFFPQVRKSVSTAQLLEVVNSVPVMEEVVPTEEVPSKNNFSEFQLIPQLQGNIINKGYTIPTPIQQKAIPVILNGQDVIGIANTGTGKTGAFLIPLINKVSQNKLERVLIITPTHELAVQIREELFELSKGLHIKSALCIGGTNIRVQKDQLRNNPNFVIGTPGRIKDLIGERSLFLGVFKNVVLDETDRMVDIGFINDIKYFISLLSPIRQSLFFSATVPQKVQEILRSFVHNAVTISVKQHIVAGTIEQGIVKIERGQNKIDRLHDLLIKEGFEKVIIFGRTKWGIQKLTNQLIERGFRAGAIHGNKNQNQRRRVLEQFKSDQIKILLATDVASRGLDIPDVSHVINYDMPATMDDYTHRIGRTGRAEKKGIALTFIEEK